LSSLEIIALLLFIISCISSSELDSCKETVKRLLDKFILPKYDDIMEYHITPNDNKIEIIFWMDGTDQETEEEIVSETYTVLSLMSSEYHFIFKFTTEGEHFYTYGI
jgi:broad specificity phosphatase PhoE